MAFLETEESFGATLTDMEGVDCDGFKIGQLRLLLKNEASI